MSDLRGVPEDFESLRRERKVVFTNGCFDIIHPGHVRLLKEAAALGDILVVGINSDDSVRRLKGPGRPVQDEKSRAEVLKALSAVDAVVIFDEDTPLEIIKKIKPDVLVKGAQYGEGEIVGEESVVETVRIPMLKGYSTTAVIERIRACVRGD